MVNGIERLNASHTMLWNKTYDDISFSLQDKKFRRSNCWLFRHNRELNETMVVCVCCLTWYICTMYYQHKDITFSFVRFDCQNKWENRSKYYPHLCDDSSCMCDMQHMSMIWIQDSGESWPKVMLFQKLLQNWIKNVNWKKFGFGKMN